MTSVTVLIPTFNRAEALRAVWPSYTCQQDVDRIVVVNDGSIDSTTEVVRRLAAECPTPVVQLEHPHKLGQQHSRMSALAAARTEWVLFGEDDVYLANDYISSLVEQAGKLRADVIAGRLVNVSAPIDFSPDRIADTATTESGPVFDLSRLDANFALRPSMAMRAPYLHSIALIRRDVFQRVHFDPWYRGNGHREETDFYLSANEIGYRAFFSPDTVCFHLRGPISATGGQRINRVAFEFWHFVNTWHLVAKHWAYLEQHHGFTGGVSTWMARYLLRRQWAQLIRIAHRDYRSSFGG